MDILLIDIRTVLFLLWTGNLVAFILLSVYYFKQNKINLVVLYTVARLAQAIAWLMLWLRGYVPLEFSYLLGNSVLDVGWAMEALAILSIRRRKWRFDIFYLVAGLFAVMACYVNYHFDIQKTSPNLGIAVVSMISVVLFIIPGLLFSFEKNASALQRSIGICYLLFCTGATYRALSALISPGEFSLMTPALSQTWAFLSLFFLLIVSSFGYLLLLKEKTDAELVQREKQLRQIIDIVPHCIFAKDGAGQFILINQAVANVYGKTVEELTGKCAADFARSAEEARYFRGNDDKVLKSGLPVNIPEERITDSTGKVRVFSTTKIPFTASDTESPALLGVSVDITERKQAEEALQKSEQRYRLLVENTSEAIVVMQDGRAKFVNRGIEWAGYTPEEYMSIPLMETVHPEDREAVEQRYLKKISGDTTPTRYTYRGLGKSGEVHWIEVSSVLIEWEGQPATLNLIVDITDRKQVERALLESEETFRLIFDNAPLGILHFNEKGIITSCNDNFVEIIGSSREVLVGLNMLNLPDQHLVAAVKLSLNGEPGYYDDDYHSVTSNNVTPVHALFAPIASEKGSVGGVGIIEDITERKKAEAEIRKSEERFRAIFERSTIGKTLTAADGRLLRINKAFADMLGYTIEEIQEINFAQITHPDDVTEGRECIRILLADEQAVYRFEKRYIHKNGNIVSANVSTTLLRDERGTPLYLITSIVDITDRKQAEKQLLNTLESLRGAVGTTIQVMVSAVETRDPYTSGHQTRSASLARAIATEMGLPQDKIEGIRMAGSIHDIGKLSIPAEILSKPTKLSVIELSLIREHARQGYEILKDVVSPWPLAEIVRQHHERMDGSGYPRNLKGAEILIEARILAVADVVEAMASHRPYRPGLGIDAALNEIEKNRGVYYDNAVADACLRLFRENGFKLETR